MDHHIDLTFVHGNGYLSDDIRGNAQLLEHILEVTAGFTGASEIFARDRIF